MPFGDGPFVLRPAVAEEDPLLVARPREDHGPDVGGVGAGGTCPRGEEEALLPRRGVVVAIAMDEDEERLPRILEEPAEIGLLPAAAGIESFHPRMGVRRHSADVGKPAGDHRPHIPLPAWCRWGAGVVAAVGRGHGGGRLRERLGGLVAGSEFVERRWRAPWEVVAPRCRKQQCRQGNEPGDGADGELHGGGPAACGAGPDGSKNVEVHVPGCTGGWWTAGGPQSRSPTSSETPTLAVQLSSLRHSAAEGEGASPADRAQGMILTTGSR